MEVKEGLVLDREGDTIYTPESLDTGPRPGSGQGGARMSIRVYRGGWWLPIALGVGIPALLVLGIFFFTVLLTLGIAVMLLRSVLGFGRKVSG